MYHTATGAAIGGIVARLLSAPPEAVGAAAALGGILGALPDVLTWSRYYEFASEEQHDFGINRWTYWYWYHEGSGFKLWRWTGFYWLHTLTDKLVHPFEHNFKSYLRWILIEASLWMPTIAAHLLVWTW